MRALTLWYLRLDGVATTGRIRMSLLASDGRGGFDWVLGRSEAMSRLRADLGHTL